MSEVTRGGLIESTRIRRQSHRFPLKKYIHEENLCLGEKGLLAMVYQFISDGPTKPSGKSGSFWEYLRDIWGRWWFYSSIVIAILELFLVVINANAGVALFFRIVFGLGILGIIPGFLTTLVLFPEGQLDSLERIALSIFLSVLISIAVGVMLGFGPYFQATTNIIVLSTYVVLADIAASYRAYQLLGGFK